MGVTFRGNPYDQENEYDSDLEINTDEEWVLPPNEILGTANRNNLLFITADEDDIDSEIFDITLDNNDYQRDNDDDTPPDEDFDEDYIPEEDNGSYSPDEDDLYNPDDENYQEFDEIESFIAEQNESYLVESDDEDEDDEELEYVTYPIAVVNDSVIPQPNKPSENNSLIRDNSDNDS